MVKKKEKIKVEFSNVMYQKNAIITDDQLYGPYQLITFQGDVYFKDEKKGVDGGFYVKNLKVKKIE